jgi:hypothetical protein
MPEDTTQTTDEQFAAEVTWLLNRAKQLDPDAWKPPYPDRMTKRRLDAVWKAKDEWDAA